VIGTNAIAAAEDEADGEVAAPVLAAGPDALAVAVELAAELLDELLQPASRPIAAAATAAVAAALAPPVRCDRPQRERTEHNLAMTLPPAPGPHP
jgi:hypothetical protein